MGVPVPMFISGSGGLVSGVPIPVTLTDSGGVPIPGGGVIAQVTLAQMFAASPSLNNNVLVQVTDIGVGGGSLWVSDGTRWKPLGMVTLSRTAIAATPLTGSTTETVLSTISIPANVMGINGRLFFRGVYSNTAGANAKTSRVRVGGTGINGTLFQTVGSTATSVSMVVSGEIANRGVANSQVGAPTSVGYGHDATAVNAPSVASIDTTATWTIYFTGLLASGADTMTLEQVEVMLLP